MRSSVTLEARQGKVLKKRFFHKILSLVMACSRWQVREELARSFSPRNDKICRIISSEHAKIGDRLSSLSSAIGKRICFEHSTIACVVMAASGYFLLLLNLMEFIINMK